MIKKILFVVLFLTSLLLPKQALALGATDCTSGNPPGLCVDQASGCIRGETPRNSPQCSEANYGTRTFICCVPSSTQTPGLGQQPGSASNLDFNAIQQQGNPNFAFNNIGDIITKLVPYFFLSAGILLLLYLLWGGISLMTTQGDPKAIESAKGRITSAFVGFVIIFVAYWLVQIIASMLGLQRILDIFKFQP